MAAARKVTGRRRRSTSSRHRPRRRTARVSTSVGAALGTVVVALLLDASWPVRIALVAAVLVLALLFVGLGNRRDRAGSAAGPGSRPSGIPNDFEGQGDWTHD